MGQTQKCNACDFQTCVPKYLKGHKVKHSGQFMCQRGCKLKFILFKDLDGHIKQLTDINSHKTFISAENVMKSSMRLTS